MAAVTAGVVGLGAGIYSANKQAGAAKDAANKQAKGVANAQALTQQAQERALPLIQQGFTDSRAAINNGANLATANILAGQDQSSQMLQNGFNQAGTTLDTYYNQATGQYEPMATQGAGASNLQAALSGALGPQAQQQAFSNYADSPGQKYLRDQQEQALLRNESALGGGVSSNGRILSALQEQAAGNAAQNYNTNFSQLGQVADRGAQATNAIANLRAGLGQSKAGIQQQLASMLSGMRSNTASNLANLNTSTAGQLAQSLQGQGTVQANTLLGVGSDQAQLAQNLGQVQSGADIYKSQNVNPLLQGIQSGLGAYGAAGGNFNFLSGQKAPAANPQYSGYNIGNNQYGINIPYVK
jgi:hypothetical protein